MNKQRLEVIRQIQAAVETLAEAVDVLQVEEQKEVPNGVEQFALQRVSRRLREAWVEMIEMGGRD